MILLIFAAIVGTAPSPAIAALVPVAEARRSTARARVSGRRAGRALALAAGEATGASYRSCAAARAAGAAPLRAGQTGYSTRLDRDRDGVACE